MRQAPDDKTQVLELRKYPNRRYYDTTHSRHVTLEEIQTLVRDGYEVRVTDSKTGEDITAKVLTQIILELDTPKLNIFPVPLLHRLIQTNEGLVRDFIDKYFSQALMSFLDSQRQFEHYLRQTIRFQAAQPMLQDWAKFMMGPFGSQAWGGGAGEAAKPDLPAEPAARSDTEDLRATIEDLRQQMSELQQAMTRRNRPRKASGK